MGVITVIEAILLGIVQGITEWLPVSSSGHLVAAQEFLGLEADLFFSLVLHLGTTAVIFVVFRKDIISILKSVVRLDFKSEEGLLFVFIVLGSIPTAAIGFFFHDLFAFFFTSIFFVGAALIVNGFVLLLSERRSGERKLGWRDSLLIGTAQGLAIIPGISRSGFTISAGLLRGIQKGKVARFSFLLMLPAVIGASVFEAVAVDFSQVNIMFLAAGFVVSFVAGYLSLKFLLRVIMRSQFHRFAYYCWVMGLALVLVSFI